MSLQGSLDMFSIPPAKYDWVPALRIALSTAVPLALIVLTGRIELTLFATFGAFVSIYGKNQTTANRFFDQSVAGSMMLASMAVGILLSANQLPHAVIIPIAALLSSICAVVALHFGLRPPGALFFVFGTGAVGMLPYNGHPWQSLCITLCTVIYVILLGILWTYLGEGKNAAAVAPSSRSTIPFHRQLEQGLVYFLASISAGYVGLLAGSPHSYWAMVSTVSAVAMPSVNARIKRAIERVSGTFVGVFAAAFVISMNPSIWHMVVLIVLAQFIGQNYIKRNYAFAMVFITPQALLMIHLVHPVPVTEVMSDRLLETAIGSLCGVIAVFLTRSPEHLEKNTVAIPALRVARKYDKMPRWMNKKDSKK